ncbi:hypothetical protein ACOI22_09735 [Glaciecola sp. 2405UD65-10]|uniref:hypothetical protein n=1 Tax=Glaciecola sp. 2405UD65-10 TaxID=3397244 RepID=UPI003B5B56F8
MVVGQVRQFIKETGLPIVVIDEITKTECRIFYVESGVFCNVLRKTLASESVIPTRRFANRIAVEKYEKARLAHLTKELEKTNLTIAQQVEESSNIQHLPRALSTKEKIVTIAAALILFIVFQFNPALFIDKEQSNTSNNSNSVLATPSIDGTPSTRNQVYSEVFIETEVHERIRRLEKNSKPIVLIKMEGGYFFSPFLDKSHTFHPGFFATEKQITDALRNISPRKTLRKERHGFAFVSTIPSVSDNLYKQNENLKYQCAENGSCFNDISKLTGNHKTIHVEGYYRSDGTYVRGHYRGN